MTTNTPMRPPPPTRHMHGWKPDSHDHRDLSYRALRPQNRLLKAILRPRAKYLKALNLPRVYNQGRIGSCVGHGVTEACAYAIDFEYARNDGLKPADYSRLFTYYNARTDKLKDDGATIRDGVKGVARHGICQERMWPYVNVEANVTVKPPQAAYDEAAHRTTISYYRIETVSDIIDCIAQGFPVVYGMEVFASFMQVGADGVVSMPATDDEPEGGHCMLIVGYSMRRRAFYVRNSWGPDWGQNGNCWVPFDYIAKYADDFWTVRHCPR